MKIFRVSADKNQIFSEKKRVFFSLSQADGRKIRRREEPFLGKSGTTRMAAAIPWMRWSCSLSLQDAIRRRRTAQSLSRRPTQRRRGSGAAESSTYSQKSEAEGGKRKCVAEREKGRGNRLEKEAKRYCRSHLVGPAVAFIVIR